MKPRLSPAQLAALLGALDVQVESAAVEDRSAALADYPGGPRPCSVLRLSGAGYTGFGEYVGFVPEEHARFANHVGRWFNTHAALGQLKAGTAQGTEGTPYERAALEAALIDLALRQARLSLHALTGVREVELRFVKSLAAASAPALAVRRLRAQGFHGELKVDVDPRWDSRALEALGTDARVVIFDFKGRADAALARRLAALHASALFEDPPVGFEIPSVEGRVRISRDAPLLDESAVRSALERGESVNLKAPRMGGPLAVFRGLELAWAKSAAVSEPLAYLGGMFEVDVGRTQARQLAALYCAAAPNDLALNLAAERAAPPPTSPALIRLDTPGFGGLVSD